MVLLRWVFLLCFAMPCMAFPGPKPLPPEEPGAPPYCSPKNIMSADCMKAVCDRLSSYDCNTSDKLDEVSCQCSGVRGDCVTAVCNHLSRYDCDERDEIFGVVKMCRGVSDASCIDYVCSKLSWYECDDINDLKKVTEMCRR